MAAAAEIAGAALWMTFQGGGDATAPLDLQQQHLVVKMDYPPFHQVKVPCRSTKRRCHATIRRGVDTNGSILRITETEPALNAFNTLPNVRDFGLGQSIALNKGAEMHVKHALFSDKNHHLVAEAIELFAEPFKMLNGQIIRFNHS